MSDEHILAFDESTGRWIVGDDELHAGDVVEIELAKVGWLPARFEWLHGGERPQGTFLIQLTGELDAVVRLPVGARVRVPVRT